MIKKDKKIVRDFSLAKRLVIKVGTSTLTYENGKLNLERIFTLVRVLSDLKNSGREVVLVSSGAIGVGSAWLNLGHRAQTVMEKQAAAAVGQPQLMGIYDDFFKKFHQLTAQILVTHLLVTNPEMYENAVNTLSVLLSHGVIPIINENDSVVTDEILFGDNDTLSAHVAQMVDADLLVLLTDIDGLYDKNPKDDPTAQLIPKVTEITDEIKAMAGGAGSNRGTGGMITKITAAEIAGKNNINTVIMKGNDPEDLYELLEGVEIGTYFDC